MTSRRTSAHVVSRSPKVDQEKGSAPAVAAHVLAHQSYSVGDEGSVAPSRVSIRCQGCRDDHARLHQRSKVPELLMSGSIKDPRCRTDDARLHQIKGAGTGKARLHPGSKVPGMVMPSFITEQGCQSDYARKAVLDQDRPDAIAQTRGIQGRGIQEK